MTDETDPNSPRGHLAALFRLLQKHAPCAADPASSPPEPSRPDDEAAPSREQHVIVRSAEEAARGQVTAVQAALRNGWKLVDIELREETDQKERRLAFVLQRTSPPSAPPRSEEPRPSGRGF